MSESLAFLTIIVLIFTAVSIWRTYRFKALLHPGLYFCILWTGGVTSYLFLSVIQNQINVYDGSHVNELNGYVLFTAFSFLIFKRLGKSKIINQPSIWSVHSFYPLYKYLVFIALFSAIAMFIIRAATFDFAATRDATVEFETALFYGERSQTLLFTILGIFLSSNIILGIYAGYKVGERLKARSTIQNLSSIVLFVPFLTQLVMMFTVGGRIDFINILRAYMFGISIVLANGVYKGMFKKVVIYLITLFVAFSVYSNFNYQQRVGKSTLDLNPVANQFSSIMEYFSMVYTGYQLRRDDFVTKEIENGEKTFAGILFFRIPFAGTLGMKNSSVGEMLNIEEYSMKKMFLELQSQNARHFSTVSSIYLLFYDDFGYLGTFVFIFLMVGLTQFVYFRWFGSTHKSLFSIFYMLLFLMLWSNSIMDPVFATGFFRSTLFSIATLQVLYYIKTKIYGR